MKHTGRNRLRMRLLSLSCAAFGIFVAGSAMAQVANVIVTVPAGTPVPQSFAADVSSWRQSGVVSDTIWLNSARDGGAFSTMVVLDFPSESFYKTWQEKYASKVPSPLTARRAQILAHNDVSPRDSNFSTFKVESFEPKSAEEFAAFTKDGLKPRLEAERGTKNLIRYTMYQTQGEGSAKPQAFLLTEYRDTLAYDRVMGAKADLEEKLKSTNATYAEASSKGGSMAKPSSETLAKYAELPPPSLPDLPGYKPEFKVVGGFRIIGSELKNAVDQLAAGFVKFHPDAKMSVSRIPSSEGGIAGLYLNASDIAPMGDDAKITDMMPFYNTFGYMPTEISVATGGFERRGSLFAWAIAVNKDNPLNEISVDELKRVFGSERSGGWTRAENDFKFTSKLGRSAESNIRTWSQLGVTGDMANKTIETFGYAAPGFATYFERNWFNWSKKWNPNFMEYVEVKQTTSDKDGSAVQSTVPLEALRTNKNAIGIAAMMHLKNFPDLKILKISQDKGGQAIEFTPENVANRSYPLIRDAYFYVNKAPGRALDPKVREFMRYVLSREGQEIISRVGYYYPLDAKYLQAQLKKLDEDVKESN